MFSACSASQSWVKRWLCAGYKSLLREEASSHGTKAEGELVLAAGMRQDSHKHVAAFMWDCRVADSVLGHFYHIPSSSGCWTRKERAQEAAPGFVLLGGQTGQLW